MKNKIVTCIILTAVILFVSVASVMAQAKSTFAGDVNINPSTTLEYGQAKVAVAYNGDVYVSRLLRLTGNTTWGGYEILKSTDGGITFHDIVGTVALPINTAFTAMDIVACGNNDADFKLVVARASLNTGTGDARLSLSWYKSDESLGAVLLDAAVYNYSTSRGWDDVSVSSDTKDPAAASTPYSISLAAIKAGAQDSIIVWTGNDGGTTFIRRGLASTNNYFRHVHCATGTGSSSSYGRVGIVWDEMIDGAAQYGNVKAHFVYNDDAGDPLFSGPYDVGVTDNVYRRPVIAMASNNGGSEIHGTIAYEADASLANFGVNIYCRQFDQLISGAPQITTLQTGRLVADGAGDQVNPHVSYNPEDDKFLYTYYNGANDALVYKTADYGASITTDPVMAHINYRDAQSAMTDPFPRVDGLTASHNYFVWTDQFETYIDMEVKWPASVQNTSVSVADMKLYPNPATNNITISFTAEENDNATLSIIDISGRILQNTTAAITKGSNKLPITLNNLPTGNYTLRISGQQTNTAVMFTVQH